MEAEGAFLVTQALQPATTDQTDACAAESSSIVYVNVGRVFDHTGGIVIDRSMIPADALFCVRNQLRSRTDNGVETSNIIVYEYDVTLSSGGSRTQAAAGSIQASSESGTAGFSDNTLTIATELMTGSEVAAASAQIGPSGAKEIIATVKYYGRTTGGLEVETPDFSIPVRVYATDSTCVCDGDPAVGEVPCPDDDAFCNM